MDNFLLRHNVLQSSTHTSMLACNIKDLDALEGSTDKVGLTTRESTHGVVVGMERNINLERVQIPYLHRHVIGTTEQCLTVWGNQVKG